MPLKNIGNSIQEINFPINVYSYIKDVDEAKKEYPKDSGLNYNSTFGQGNFFNEVVGNKFFPVYMPNNEIPRSSYRSGVENFNDLTSFLQDGVFYVKPGEYSIEGTVIYLNYLNYQNLATSTLAQELLTVPVYATKPSLNFFKAAVYKNESFWMSPSEHNIAGEYSPQNYIGYSFTDDQNLWVNNYVYRESEVKLPVVSKRFYEADFDISSESLELHAELLGVIQDKDLGTSQYFNSIYSPMTEVTSTPGVLTDSKTHIAVDTDGTIDFYTLKNSYMESELFALEQILKQIADDPGGGGPSEYDGEKVCYVNRYKGEVFFSKQTLSGAISSLSLPPPGGGIVSNGVAIPSQYLTGGELDPSENPYFVITFDEPSIAAMFDDCGLVRISGVGSGYGAKQNVLIFNKIGSKTVQFRWPDFEEYLGDPLYTKETFGDKIFIYPYSAMFTPDEGAKVYALYDAVIEFQKEVPTAKREFLFSEIKPWLWKKQRTIAVLSKSEKVYPYYISLKPIETPYLYTKDGISVYGPLYNGAEIVLLEGQVTSYDGQPVIECDVTVNVLTGEGNLDGEVSIVATTDDEGKFYTSYDPKSSRAAWLNFKDADIVRGATSTTLHANSDYNDSKLFEYINSGDQQVIVYTILKDDGSLGTLGNRLILGSKDSLLSEVSPSQEYKKMLTGPFGDRFEGRGSYGFYIFDFFSEEDVAKYVGGKVKLSYLSYSGFENEVDFVIKDIQSYPEVWRTADPLVYEYQYPKDIIDYRFNTYLILIEEIATDELTNAADINTIGVASFFTSSDVQYDDAELNGRRVVIAESKTPRENWLHPSIDDYSINKPIFGPVFTSTYDSNTKRFTVNSVLPLSNSTDPTKVIAGFSLFPEKFATLQATTLGKYNIPIYSNKAQFYITLNDRDKGVVKTLLNKYVPYGFRIRDDVNYAGSSTIDMETFLTINVSSGNSFSSHKFPLISYLDGNGIIYSGTAYKTDSSSLGLTLKSTED